MKFIKLNRLSEIDSDNEEIIYLIEDNWNDWYKYCTLYQVYFGTDYIGNLKIGSYQLKDRRPDLPDTFSELSEDFFSLGQSEGYYIELNEKLPFLRSKILNALRDIAFDDKKYEEVKDLSIVRNSLMRDISRSYVEGRFRRLSHGDATQTEYNFSYVFRNEEMKELSFNVAPEEFPPSNIHVIIGRNGTGKSFILNKMLNSLVKNENDYGEFVNLNGEQEIFSKVISVSFSAFDDYEPIKDSYKKKYTYLGLKEFSDKSNKFVQKSPSKLTDEFAKSILKCSIEGKMDLWNELIEDLKYDPFFDSSNISNLLSYENLNLDQESIIKKAVLLFKSMSSGHKIVLLSLARLIENVEEKTLVLMDEPESYLHPPLISAYVQVISKLLRKKNAIAILATHSPVILQEIPRKCIWKIRKEGNNYSINRPSIETFGENFGIINREVFVLEVSQTGFHKMIEDAVERYGDYESVLEHFNNELGDEAKNLVMTLTDDEGDF